MRASKQRREREAKIQDLDGAIDDLKTAVQEVERQGKEAQIALTDSLMEAQEDNREGVQGEFDRKHRELSELHVSYGVAMQRLYREVLAAGDFSRFQSRHPRGIKPKPILLQVNRASSVYVVNERCESPVLSTILR